MNAQFAHLIKAALLLLAVAAFPAKAQSMNTLLHCPPVGGFLTSIEFIPGAGLLPEPTLAEGEGLLSCEPTNASQSGQGRVNLSLSFGGIFSCLAAYDVEGTLTLSSDDFPGQPFHFTTYDITSFVPTPGTPGNVTLLAEGSSLGRNKDLRLTLTLGDDSLIDNLLNCTNGDGSLGQIQGTTYLRVDQIRELIEW